jgi:hypothetical protein
MSSRYWGSAVLGIVTLALVPVWGQSQAPSYNKDAVQTLSKQIDEHFAKVWKKANVTPEPKANDYVFLRRLNLDLVGRIPKLQYITDFMDDDRADKRWVWVDRLLDDTENARPAHFANMWRSIILGNQTNQQFQFLMPQFEAWLRERVEKNMPLDKIVQELLTSQPQNQNQPFFNGNGQQPANPQLFFLANENKAENLAGVSSRVFLGVKIECAQCHAHPFASWSKDQFWEFAAFFSAPPPAMRRPGIGLPAQPKLGFEPGREIMIPGSDKVVKAKFLNGETPKWEGPGYSRKTLTDWMTSPKNPYFAKAMADHIWTYLMGVSLLEPIMEPSDDSPITHPELLNALAKGLVDNNFDAKFLIRAIVHSDAYQRSSGGKKLADKEDYHLFVRMPMRALSPEQIYDSIFWATKNYDEKEAIENPNQFNPFQGNSPRAQFLAKFMNQDRRHEPQTSILQALFMMNGKFMAEKTKVENSENLQAILNGRYENGNAGRVTSMYRLILSRVPRPEESLRLGRYLDQKAADGQLSQGISDIYWALLNTSEFLHNH